MSERDEDLVRLADAMPTIDLRWNGFRYSLSSRGGDRFRFPAETDALHAHLEFVGRLVEETGYTLERVRLRRDANADRIGWAVTLSVFSWDEQADGAATDPSWAAVRAALAAKGVHHG